MKNIFRVRPLQVGVLMFLVAFWLIFKDARHPIKLLELLGVGTGMAFFGLMCAALTQIAIRTFEGADVGWSEPDEDRRRAMQFDDETYYNVDGTPMIGGMGGIDLNGHTYGRTSNDE